MPAARKIPVRAYVTTTSTSERKMPKKKTVTITTDVVPTTSFRAGQVTEYPACPEKGDWPCSLNTVATNVEPASDGYNAPTLGQDH